MAATAEQLLEQAKKVLDARDVRVQLAVKAEASEAAAKLDRTSADTANATEDTEIDTFKTMAHDYTK